MKTVGSYELKTHLAKFLRLVMRGETIEVTSNGKPVAKLIPPAPVQRKKDPESIVEEFRIFRDKHSLGKGLTIRDLIEEGRKY